MKRSKRKVISKNINIRCEDTILPPKIILRDTRLQEDLIQLSPEQLLQIVQWALVNGHIRIDVRVPLLWES